MTHPIQPTVKLAQVEVFRTQALLTHLVSLTLLEDQFKVEFVLNELPLATLDSSVRIAPSKPGAARVMDIHIGLEAKNQLELMRTTREQTLVDLLRQKLRLTLSHKHESSYIDYLSKLQPALVAGQKMPEHLAYQQRSLDSWQAFSQAVCQQMRTRSAKRRQLACQLRELDEQIHQAGLELEGENQHDREALAVLQKSCRIRIQRCTAEQALEFRLSYLVQGAQWVPEYELRVYQDQAELVLKALVAQRTGHDWHQVPLAFSTSDLSRSTRLPTLDSWRISKVQPKPVSSWRPLPQGLDELFVAYDQSKKSAKASHHHRLPTLPTLPPIIQPEEGLLSLPRYRQEELHQQTDFEGTHSANQPETSKQNKKSYATPQADFEEMDQGPYPCSPPIPVVEEMPQAFAPGQGQASLMTASFSPSSLGSGRSKASKHKRLSRQFAQPQSGSDESNQHTESTLEASEQALRYQSLRMQDAEHAQRGQLAFVGSRERLLEQSHPNNAETKQRLSRLCQERWEDMLEQTWGSSHLADFPQDSVRIAESIGHFCVRYPMQGLGSVAPDGKPHALSLLSKSESIKRIYRCVPAIEQRVYQLVEFENPLPMPLLAGPMRVYRQNEFVVRTPLALTPPGKKLTVNLGVEPAVSVARNTHYQESSEGLFGGDTALEHKVQIEVRSKLPSAIQLEVLERIPTSDDQVVKVELVKSNPRAHQYDQTERGQPIRGGLRFQLALEPYSTQICELHYRIIMPSKQVLKGGNRRD